MRKVCRFEECGAYGHINAIPVEVSKGIFYLEWCSICGRIQNKFK